MAESILKFLPSSCLVLFVIILLFDLSSGENVDEFWRSMSPSELSLKQEKLSHLHFYFHDNQTGPDPTAVRIAEATITNSSTTRFGSVWMMDDPLTVGPEPTSKTVGRAQGLYASASKTEVGYLMVLTFAFTEGKYNGSTLSVLGRNTIRSAIREMPIVGGSGLFRFARGYAQAHTHTVNFQTHNAIVEYNVYVFHY